MKKLLSLLVSLSRGISGVDPSAVASSSDFSVSGDSSVTGILEKGSFERSAVTGEL